MDKYMTSADMNCNDMGTGSRVVFQLNRPTEASISNK